MGGVKIGDRQHVLKDMLPSLGRSIAVCAWLSC